MPSVRSSQTQRMHENNPPTPPPYCGVVVPPRFGRCHELECEQATSLLGTPSSCVKSPATPQERLQDHAAFFPTGASNAPGVVRWDMSCSTWSISRLIQSLPHSRHPACEKVQIHPTRSFLLLFGSHPVPNFCSRKRSTKFTSVAFKVREFLSYQLEVKVLLFMTR